MLTTAIKTHPVRHLTVHNIHTCTSVFIVFSVFFCASIAAPVQEKRTMAKSKQTEMLLVLPRTLVLSLLLLLLAVNSAKAEPTLQACGAGLNDVLYIVCKGKFAPVIANKRASLDLFDYVEQQNGLDSVVDSAVNPWRHQLNTILATRRYNRGVVDECCHKSCTIEEIKVYCSLD